MELPVASSTVGLFGRRQEQKLPSELAEEVDISSVVHAGIDYSREVTRLISVGDLDGTVSLLMDWASVFPPNPDLAWLVEEGRVHYYGPRMLALSMIEFLSIPNAQAHPSWLTVLDELRRIGACHPFVYDNLGVGEFLRRTGGPSQSW